MKPENNMIAIIQNLWLTITSSIGYALLTPFYEVMNILTKKDEAIVFQSPSGIIEELEKQDDEGVGKVFESRNIIEGKDIPRNFVYI